MKRFIVLESSILAFFIGVIVSTYILFLDSVNGYLSPVLNYISLRPVVETLAVANIYQLVAHFLLYIAVYIIYGLVIGLIIRKYSKFIFVAIPLIILILGYVAFQQISHYGVSNNVNKDISDIGYVYVPPVRRATNEVKNDQYFGNEAHGDLNGDGLDDIAFIISRNDPDRGILYYLAGSLATENGHAGTNLLFLGDKVEPKSISIATGTIDVAYINHSIKNSTSTKDFFAGVIKGNLEQIKQEIK